MATADQYNLDLDDEDLAWQNRGLCCGIPTFRKEDGSVYDPMFDTYESDKVVASVVDEMCLRCPVFKQCFSDGIENKQDGVHGGTYLNGGTVDKNRNAHKTPEVWAAIQNRIIETDED